MSVIYIPRVFGGTLQVSPPPATNAILRARNGTVVLRARNGTVVLRERNGNVVLRARNGTVILREREP